MSCTTLGEALEEYGTAVELLTLRTPTTARYLLGPRLVAALPMKSPQRKLAMRMSRKPDDEKGIAHIDGPSSLIKVLISGHFVAS